MAVTNNGFTNTLLPVGQTTFGPFPATFTTATITINRTGSGSHPWLNTLTSASTLDVLIQSSPDGVTWSDEVEASTIGGVITDRHGTVTTFVLGVGGTDSGAAQVRAIATVAGPSSIEVSGSIATT